MTATARKIEQALSTGALNDAPLIARSNQGEIHRLEIDGQALAIKTAAGHGPLALANRIALKREARAYERLEQVAGIPRCFGFFGKRCLVLEFVQASPFRDHQVPEEFFDKLFDTIRAMHALGVAHGDLKRKSNLLVDANGDPLLVDFGASVTLREGFHPLNRQLFQFMRQTDINAWVKLKYGGYEAVAEPDRPLLKRSRLERLLARLRR